MPNRLLSPFRMILRKIANQRLPGYFEKSISYKPLKIIDNLVVSVTSYPARIDNVWLVVECIKRQTYQPEKIILWLYKEQFKDRSQLPDSLKREEDDLFEIRLIDDNIRSHTKYYYAFSMFPNKTIVTVDDDIFYPPKTIEHLVNTHIFFPSMVTANITSKISYHRGCLLPYKKWSEYVGKYDNVDLLQKGVGGVLYPPRLISPFVLRKDVFMSVIPYADDLWLNAMTRIQGVSVVQTPSRSLLITIESNSPTLDSINNGQSKNDEQLKDVRKYLIDNLNIDPYVK